MEQARALLPAHCDGHERGLVLDRAAYELDDVQLRPLGLAALVVTQQARLLLTLCGSLVQVRPASLDAAADLESGTA